MIRNVIDNRQRRYRWSRVNAVVEPTYHDNACEDSDQAPVEEELPSYDEINAVPLRAAVLWAEELQYSVTLYLYDVDRGTHGALRSRRAAAP